MLSQISFICRIIKEDTLLIFFSQNLSILVCPVLRPSVDITLLHVVLFVQPWIIFYLYFPLKIWRNLTCSPFFDQASTHGPLTVGI